MPSRRDENGVLYPRFGFVCSTQMQHLMYQACLKTHVVSNTVYAQQAICAALARDLDLDYDDLMAQMPPPRGPAKHLYKGDRPHPLDRSQNKTKNIRLDQTGGVVRIGGSNTIEEVR